MEKDIIYIHLNNWFGDRDYPNKEPIASWIAGDCEAVLFTEKFAVENKLCIVAYPVDMSISYNITAPKEWVEKNCPFLLTTDTQYLVVPDKNGNIHGPYTKNKFLLYKEDNIGFHLQKEEL